MRMCLSNYKNLLTFFSSEKLTEIIHNSDSNPLYFTKIIFSCRFINLVLSVPNEHGKQHIIYIHTHITLDHALDFPLLFKSKQIRVNEGKRANYFIIVM